MEEKHSWKCAKCGYTFEQKAGVAPPDDCPGCRGKCDFVNVTCYVPDCGQKGQDPRLGRAGLHESHDDT